MEELKVQQISGLPIIKHYIEDLGISEVFDSMVEDGKEEVATHSVLTMLVMNILMSASPLYKMSDWLRDYSDGLGELGVEAGKYNDKRLGRALDKLYESDRHGMMSSISANAIKLHALDTSEIHNDSTTISFSGKGYDKRNQGSVEITWGHNKDHRPDYKQIVYGLNVIGDGHVPLLGSLYDGNRSDDTTHQVNWEMLRDFLKKEDFIYIADSKLSTTENMTYIAGSGGKFISILARTRKEVQDFYGRLQREKLAAVESWPVAYEVESSRKKGQYEAYRIYEGEKTKEDFDLIWVHSSAKARQDAKSRADAIAKVSEALEDLSPKLNTYYLKSEQAIEERLSGILGRQKAFFDITLIAHSRIEKKKIGRGRTGPNSKFREEVFTDYQLKWDLNEKALKEAARTDGIFPLVSNTGLAGKQVLQTYKNQPHLEKRFYNLKSILEVAPVFLEKPRRIEALLFLYFVALMVMALIERRIRLNMQEEELKAVPILPQKGKTKKPTWNNIRHFFGSIIAISILAGMDIERLVIKGLTPCHKQVLDLLEVPLDLYSTAIPLDWWRPPGLDTNLKKDKANGLRPIGSKNSMSQC